MFKLRMTMNAWAKYRYMCREADTEIGGFGVSSKDNPFLVTEFHTVKQECTAASVELDDEALADYTDQQVDQKRHPSEFLRIWLHTHPSDSTTPSATDWTMMEEKFETCDWAIMGIMGKDGDKTEAHLWTTWPETGYIRLGSIDVAWDEPFEAGDPKAWQDELEANVSSVTYVNPTYVHKPAQRVPSNSTVWKKTAGVKDIPKYKGPRYYGTDDKATYGTVVSEDVHWRIPLSHMETSKDFEYDKGSQMWHNDACDMYVQVDDDSILDVNSGFTKDHLSTTITTEDTFGARGNNNPGSFYHESFYGGFGS